MPRAPSSAPSRPALLAAMRGSASDDLLAEDVTFSSPFADYHGRADVVHLFNLIGRVLTPPVVTDAGAHGAWTYTSFTGCVDGREFDAVVRESYDDVGRLLHATLFLRPYDSLRAAMAAMARLLLDAPLPSSR